MSFFRSDYLILCSMVDKTRM